MSFPTPHTVQLVPWVSSSVDAHGNPVEGYGDPEDIAVYGWSVPTSSEQHDRVVVDVNLYAPPQVEVTPRDRIVLSDGPNAGLFDVVGEVFDYTHGPFQWRPGVVVSLRRVEG